MTGTHTPWKGLWDSFFPLVVMVLGLAIFALLGTSSRDLQTFTILAFPCVTALALYRFTQCSPRTYRWLVVAAVLAVVLAFSQLRRDAPFPLLLLAVPTFVIVTALLALCRRTQPTLGIDARLLVAIVLAYSGTWLGLGNTETWDGPAAWPSGPTGWEFSSEYELWLEENGASTDYYHTTIVTGFPLQGIESTYTGGARSRLLPGKGLEAMIANFLLQTAAFVAVAFALPRRLLWLVSWAAVALTPVTGLLGRAGLILLLD